MTNIQQATALIAEFDPAAARVFATQPFNRATLARAFRAGFRTHSHYTLTVCALVDSIIALEALP